MEAIEILKLMNHLLFSVCFRVFLCFVRVRVCWCNCMSLCVFVCVCTCLFCLAVPTVLARERSPSPRTHPGGVCLCRLRGGHHQQNISDLQCSTGTATLEKKNNTAFIWSGCRIVFLLCWPFFRTFGTCLSSPWYSQQPIYSVTADLTHPTRVLACPFKLCQVIRFLNHATALMPWSQTTFGQISKGQLTYIN